MTEFVVVVPARMESTRLPEKPLADLDGQPMLVRVLHRAALSGARLVVAAVDDERLSQAASAAQFGAIITGEHESGSSRVAEAITLLNLDDDTIVVNVQGDEPFMEPEIITQVAALLAERDDCVCATACRPLRTAAEYADASAVKVVTMTNGVASYFSRAPIPHQREETNSLAAVRIHLGIYACRAAYWRCWTALPPAPAEQLERLEQLRILWHGGKIALLECDSDGFGIDTADDLARARAHLAQA